MTLSRVMACLIVSLGLALAWGPLVRARASVQATTLRSTWNWSVAAAGVWTLSWTMDLGLRVVSAPAADHLWYASAVLALCPPLAVLGSRRPGTRVWAWFIQAPMLLVLGWPVLTLWLQGSEVRGLQLETPQLVAYLLVLIMGAGNYWGTRFTLASLCYAAACGIVVLSSSVASPGWLAERWWARLWASGLLALAIVLASRSSAHLAADRFDRLWLDFFDTFGVVWGRRIQDRINFIAQKEGWSARLELHGFEWSGSRDEVTEARIEHAFRWLLRRFVDPPWIDQRLGTRTAAGKILALGADS